MAMPDNRAMVLMERLDWDALPPRFRFKVKLPVNAIILRYTGTKTCDDDESCELVLQDAQKKLFTDNKTQPDVFWNFMIGGNGKVYEGTGWKHTTNKDEEEFWDYEFVNYDIAYIGKNNNDVNADMRWAARKLIEHGMLLGYIEDDADMIGDKTAIAELHT